MISHLRIPVTLTSITVGSTGDAEGHMYAAGLSHQAGDSNTFTQIILS